VDASKSQGRTTTKNEQRIQNSQKKYTSFTQKGGCKEYFCDAWRGLAGYG